MEQMERISPEREKALRILAMQALQDICQKSEDNIKTEEEARYYNLLIIQSLITGEVKDWHDNWVDIELL